MYTALTSPGTCSLHTDFLPCVICIFSPIEGYHCAVLLHMRSGRTVNCLVKPYSSVASASAADAVTASNRRRFCAAPYLPDRI